MNWNGFGRKATCPNRNTILALACKDLGKEPKTKIRIVSDLAKI
jgi:hypothetical protein